ncbi:pyrrolidone-carboxylate peptidase [Kribbella sp. VKM Ac-2568]|nr:pyrrolidone-carboxylate peptidase [Kribbella sp. VKM Ac-2568]
MRLRPSSFSRATVAGALVLSTALTAAPPATATSSTTAGPAKTCSDQTVAGTVEEQRLDNGIGGGPSVPAEILARSGFDNQVALFGHLLCAVPSRAAASILVRVKGEVLWKTATYRAQHPQTPPALPSTDDRGLYWARISMAHALRQWQPRFSLSTAERAALIRTLEYSSRGITSSRFSSGVHGSGVEKVLVTGFDPFTLDADIRIGNPSGANALSLDGQRWRVNGKTYEIQTVVFPVRYTDFDENMVEDALAPHYRPGAQHADLVMTASQGRVGIFDLEVFNGRRRSVSSIGDNNNLWGGGTVNAPVVSPSMPAGPEWLTTSLPTAAMAATDVTPFRTRVNTSVLEIPAGETLPVRRPLGPTPGSVASEGAGGGYLSNEVAYRNTLQRDLLDPTMPAGHLHVPVLQFDRANTTAITDPTYEANRDAIVAGAHAILRNGLG